MQTTIDGAGRLVIPKALRDRMGLAPGAAVDVEEIEGVIEIRVLALPMSVAETDEGPVLVATSDVPALGDADVRAALDQVRR